MRIMLRLHQLDSTEVTEACLANAVHELAATLHELAHVAAARTPTPARPLSETRKGRIVNVASLLPGKLFTGQGSPAFLVQFKKDVL